MRVRPVPLLVAIFGTAAATSVLVAAEALRHREPPAPEPARAVVAPVVVAPRAVPRDAGAVEGTVIDVAGRPLAGAHVRAVSRDANRPAAPVEGRTDFDGRFRLEGLAAGPAEIAAREEGVLAGISRAVEVVKGGTARVELVLPDAGHLAGRVRAAGRPPPPGTTVVAVALGGSSGTQEIVRAAPDAAGSFRLALPAGEYRVNAVPRDAPANVRVRPSFARIEPGRTTALELALDVAPMPSVEILVLEPGGEPSRGAEVTLARPDDGRVALATSAGADGRVALGAEGMAGRAVTVRARNGGRAATQTLALPAAGTVTVRLEPAGAIEAVVRGAGASGLTVEVASQPAPGVWRTLDVHRFAGKRFALADLPAERLRISVRAADGRRGATEVRISPGERRAVEIALR
jgi:Carboxypeptidase regulatory-like domain